MPYQMDNNLFHIRHFSNALNEYESREFSDMADQWIRIEKQLQSAIDALAYEVHQLSLEGKDPSISMIYRMDRFQSLQAQIKIKLDQYTKYSERLIREGQEWHLQQGLEKGVADIRDTYASRGRYQAGFKFLPYKAIENMVGMLGNGSPLESLLAIDYPETALAIGNKLISNIALGVNPNDTARQIAEYLRGDLLRSMTIARTEQNRCFRTANVMQYQESGVVEGYYRNCAFEDRTCMACLVLDGTFYRIDEMFSDHPNGRCFSTPALKGLPRAATKTGLDWFLENGEDQQKKMMGPEYYDAWKGGHFDLKDLGVLGHSDEWGEQVQIAPLSSLISIE